MNTDYPYTIRIPSSAQHPAVDASVGRITVILGGNGTGKSALLQSMHNSIGPSLGCTQTRKVDARRIMQVIGKSSLRRAEVDENIERVADNLLESYTTDAKQMQTAASKLLEALCHRDRLRDIEYAAECDRLARAGAHAAIKSRRSSPLDEFRKLFKSVLPNLELEFNTSTVTLRILKGSDVRYGPESLSSGEQQIFMLLGKFIFVHSKVVFLIDEPELNLNPRLAEKFWGTIERRHPDCAFIYATHALHFALRPEVERALVLTRDGVVPLDSSHEFLALARDDREQFLGSIPSIVLAEKVLFTEGKADSIDRPLYEYLLADSSVKVEAIGSCEEVEKAVCGKQGWANFTRDAQIAGVIDADYKTSDELKRLRALDVFMLPLHEAESILCFPEAVEALSRAMHPAQAQVSTADITQALVARLRRQRISIALKRATEVFRTQFAPSIPAADLAGILDDAQALVAFEQAATRNVSFLQAQDPRAVLKAELERIDAALLSGDAEALLRLLPGKDLARQVCAMLRIKGHASDLLAYYEKHFPNAGIPYFQAIRTSLLELFSPRPDQTELKPSDDPERATPETLASIARA